ncbi:hypothetical protein TNCV_2254711 [Trichonephila clavipes]|nr:hypothetical protein TNCV_2254711 [Trichonephila clavipes]
MNHVQYLAADLVFISSGYPPRKGDNAQEKNLDTVLMLMACGWCPKNSTQTTQRDSSLGANKKYPKNSIPVRFIVYEKNMATDGDAKWFVMSASVRDWLGSGILRRPVL